MEVMNGGLQVFSSVLFAGTMLENVTLQPSESYIRFIKMCNIQEQTTHFALDVVY